MSDVPYKYLKDNGEVFYPVTGPSSFSSPVPISKGGTGATTAAEARQNLGITGASSPTLLWTNSSPSSSFAAQTVAISLAAYSFVIIEVLDYTSPTQATSQIFPVPTYAPSSGTVYNRLFSMPYSGTACVLAFRGFSVSTTGVSFLGGNLLANLGQAATSNNSYCIPYRIWGMK